MRGFLIILLLICIMGIISIVVVKKLEVKDIFFESYPELAATEGIFDAGWIPDWLPKSARQIRESHDLDSNEGWLAFEFDRNDNFYGACIPKPGTEISLADKRQIARFIDIFGEADTDLRDSSRWSVYFCGGESARHLFVAKDRGLAYVWLIPR